MSRTARIAPWLVFFFVALRMVLIVQTSPLIAYANNWDFARESGCYGVWEQYPDGKDKTTLNFAGPVNPLIYDGDRRPEWCAYVVDNAFIGAILAFHQSGDTVRLQEVGLLRATFLIAMTGWLLLLLQRHRLLAAVTFLVAFGDIAYLSFFNTLYAEFSMLAGAYLALFGVVLLLHDQRRPSLPTIAFCSIALLFFAGAKEQYMPLAVLTGLGMAAAALFKWRAHAIAGWLVAVTIAAPATFFAVNSHSSGVMGAIKVANIMDTVMVGVLPQTRDPISSMRKLGLPDSCAKAIGVSWYAPGVANNLPCPEITKVSRVQIFRLFFNEPDAFFKPMYLATTKVRPLQLDYLTNTENVTVRDSHRYALLKSTSITTWLDEIPAYAFSLLVCFSIFAGGICTLFLMRSASMLLMSAGGVIVFYALFSSVFGDGFMEISKHATAIVLGLSLQISVVLIHVIRWMVGEFNSEVHPG